ncbi:hypothetical protein [Halococcus agarilyticus]|uniref:hypothetical protein n=1 Tax=Halococcus agarilyticus TaxID=1232219 RepID=UPI000677E52E|nr:hypothetical protein [Halococcus agarilyticus]
MTCVEGAARERTIGDGGAARSHRIDLDVIESGESRIDWIEHQRVGVVNVEASTAAPMSSPIVRSRSPSRTPTTVVSGCSWATAGSRRRGS